MRVASVFLGVVLGASVGLAGCKSGSSAAPAAGQRGAQADGNCTGFCQSPNTYLTVADVQRIIAQAVAEAGARGVNATVAVTDRIGNVLAVFAMNGANTNVRITSLRQPQVQAPFSGASLEGVQVSARLAAISKAVTGAYLSSEGNAFTTRTANQIVQENFNPGETNRPGGPLFGVQFSQLACSDLASLNNLGVTGSGGNIAPNSSPLGLAADPGGLPIYKGGTPVGGIGVMSDGIYGLDLVISDQDLTGVRANDESIALAGTVGFDAPGDRIASRITVDGKTFRFTDVTVDNLITDAAAIPPFNAINGVVGGLVDAGVAAAGTAFFTAANGIRNGVAFGQPFNSVPGVRFSGVVPAGTAAPFPGRAAFRQRDGFVLTTATNANAYPPVAGTSLTLQEVIQLMSSALDVANSARAQIRRPVNSQMRATISVVDTNGAILGIVRTRDGPMFGTDVSLQKARTAVLFSSPDAANALGNTANGVLNAFNAPVNVTNNTLATRVQLAQGTAANQFSVAVGATALTDGIAFADRSGGNLSRPFFPDGIAAGRAGPFSNPLERWSPFATGLQLELVFEQLTTILFNPNAAAVVPLLSSCSGQLGGQPMFGAAAPNRVGNGIQIFPGSVPVYRNGTLVGGIGVSGDGIDQDDMVSFLGTHNAGLVLGTGVGNAPPGIRADTVTIQGVNLRYVQCPQAPFLNSSQQNPCQGK